jgi:ATP-dependent RNA helicase RhlE
MTKQKIPDGDLLGFDASTVEAERPEVREPRQPRNAGPKKAKAEGADKPQRERNNGGRRDKGKDSGKEQKAKPQQQGQGQGQGQGQNRRGQQPRNQSRGAAPAIPPLPPDRDPEEFLDDEIDNFGNRADYVPVQNKPQGRGRRPGAAAADNGAAQGQSQKAKSSNRQPRSNAAGTPATPGKNRRQGGQGRTGGGRGRPAHDGRITSLDRDELPRTEAAVRNPREKQPIIMHKGSRLDRFPSAEQLDELSNSTRPRGEKPALLTRNREE